MNKIKSKKDAESVKDIQEIMKASEKLNDEILEDNGFTSVSLITEIGHDPCLVIKACDAKSKVRIRGKKLILEFLDGLDE